MNYIPHHHQQQQQLQQLANTTTTTTNPSQFQPQPQPQPQQLLPQLQFLSQLQPQPHPLQVFEYQQQQQLIFQQQHQQQPYQHAHNESFEYFHPQQQPQLQQHLQYYQHQQPQAQLQTPLLQQQYLPPPQQQQQQPPAPASQQQQQTYVPQLYQQVKPSPLIEKLATVLPHPPLSLATIAPESLSQHPPKRLRRRSKYTKEQDEMIVKLKKLGRSWVSIADLTGVGSFLAARNRYQVLIGQQGGGTSECDLEDIMSLQSLIDEGEVEKWRFISKELHKSTGKNFSDRELQDIVRTLFWSNPESFGITDDYLKAFMKIKSSSSPTGPSSTTANSSINFSSNSSTPTSDKSVPTDQVDQFTTQPRFQEDFYPPSYQYNQQL